ncbi:HAMP domain-containing sensor histidine kinase [Streptomyces sp. 71268]|uniref:sensor histidine kinase n=1 Tax=Streptomyces sp. 71268 TaxID=3002640 RepID=UPI0023F87354|nr:HAMP domain-containing sensor histidine kinase [Streptomyces sp. 71268]WEV26331.1 HAMP domain-containing sensor histidine kinase [Streptomyces sp. 71268]
MNTTSPRRGAARLSLRTRLVIICLLLVVAALLASNALLITLLQRQLVDQMDERLRTAAAAAVRLPDPGTHPDATAPPERDAVERQLTGDVYVVRLNADGSLSQRPRPAVGDVPELPRLDAAAVAARGGAPFEASGDGHDWRVIAQPAPSPPRQNGDGGREGDKDRGEERNRNTDGDTSATGSIVVAGSLEEVNGTIRGLGVRMLVIDSLVLVLLGVIGWFAVRAGLRPLRRIETTAAAIAGGDLSRRVPDLASSTRTELGRLAAALNGMLDRIEAGDAARAATNDRMRAFVADASHELRTPLFGIKGFTELYRMGGMPERADVDTAMNRIERESARLAHIVEDLLLLARLDEDPTARTELPLEPTPMDLRTLAADALHDLRALAPDRTVTLTGPGGGPPGAAPVLGDEARLRQVMSNLIGNAIAHTPAGTPVRIGVGTHDALAILELGDQGPGMTAEQAARVFDRFYRADTARGRTRTGGAGLGLSIAHSLVAAHHGRMEVHTSPGQGATFRILLPVHTDPLGD